MTNRFRLALPLALGLAVPSIVSATETPPSSTRSGAGACAGVVTETRQGGFSLVTLGSWTSPKSDRLGAQMQPNTSRTRRSSRPNERAGRFRRAIYFPHVATAERQYALPPGLLDALIWTESRYNPLALSRAGAAGLGQLMPGTAQALGIGNRYEPLANITGSARYLRTLLDRFGMVHLAIAAYNAGPGAVQRAGRIPMNGETPGYVRDVLRNWR
jgi:soluble lytic murein transglycosylase-like protein